MLKDQIHIEDIPNNVALTFTVKTYKELQKKQTSTKKSYIELTTEKHFKTEAL